jgi:hypothetical protein
MVYYNNKYADYTDSELLQLWSSSKLNSLPRIYIYQELHKRNKLHLLEQFYSVKNSKNEFICAKFKQGYFSKGGISSLTGSLIHVFSIVFLELFILVLKYSYLNCFPITSCISKNLHDKLVVLACILLLLILLFLDFFMSSYILITNKSLVLYKCFFLLFKFTIKKILLNDLTIINKINLVFYLPFNDKTSSIIIKFSLFTFDKKFSETTYILKCNLAAIFDEWLRTLSITNNFKCVMFSLEPFTIIGSDNNNIHYHSNDITNYYHALCHIPKKLLFEFTIKNVNFYYFLNFLNILPIDYTDINLFYPNDSFFLENEQLFGIFKNKSIGLGICKSKLLITNERLIELSNDNKYIISYYLSDTNLIFNISHLGITIFYKTTFKYIIFWYYINIPLLDLIKFKRDYE